MKISYVVGNALEPIDPVGRKIIAHCCNDVGGWGAGFVVAISKKWSQPEQAYREWARLGKIEGMPFKQGQCHVVPIPNTKIAVANIIGQSDCGYYMDLPPVRYGAIHEGFLRLRQRLHTTTWSLHMPRIGCGLAGGEWGKIEDILNKVFAETNIPITVYDLN